MAEKQATVISIQSVIVLDTTKVRDIRIAINRAKGNLRDIDNRLSSLMDKKQTADLINLLTDHVEQIDFLLSQE